MAAEALYHFASTCGYDFKLLKGVISANRRQKELMVEKVKHHLGNLKGKTIGILGLSFKQNTDDIRKSPAIDIIKLLLKEGATRQLILLSSYSKKEQTSNALTPWQ